MLRPLGIEPEQVYFTDCLPTYFIKPGSGGQAEAMATYGSFATAQDPPLPTADLPTRPSPRRLVHRAITEEALTLRAELTNAAAPTVVTLGQEAADVLAGIADAEPVRLTPGDDYGNLRSVTVGDRRVRWIPLIHPGNRDSQWRGRHEQWKQFAATVKDRPR